jgi:lipopolysaccharide biosynthesis glycosyltransferase
MRLKYSYIIYSYYRMNNKNLVYMSVFHNKDYLQLLEILMMTVKYFSKTDTIDFLVLTTESFADNINKLSRLINIPILMKFFTFTTMHESSCARLYIFDYENISSYDKLLYIDTDITVINDITTLFNINIEDKVYALEEKTIEHEYYGGWFFDFNIIDKDTPGMNAGILLFRNNDMIRTIFHDAIKHINRMRAENANMPECLDQPFINYHIIKNGKQDTHLMKSYAIIYSKDAPLHKPVPSDIILCHFTWPIGNAMHKKYRMINHIDHIFNNYTNIYTHCQGISTPDILLGKVYSWGNTNGVIQFDENRLLTTWAYGTYKWLNSHLLEASWDRYVHILIMNESYTSFISVRKEDFDITIGSVM